MLGVKTNYLPLNPQAVTATLRAAGFSAARKVHRVFHPGYNATSLGKYVVGVDFCHVLEQMAAAEAALKAAGLTVTNRNNGTFFVTKIGGAQ